MNSKRRIVAYSVAGILALFAGLVFYNYAVRVPMELAGATAQGIREFFNFTPRVKVNQVVVIEQNTPIMEVAVVARQVMVDHSWSHTWLGSTKRIRLVGTFTAKAGFDLKEAFTISIEKNPLRVFAALPSPKILSLTMESYTIALDESGWWNRISSADREAGMRDLHSAARAQVESSGILEEARQSARQRIKEIVQRNGANVEFVPAAGL